MTFAMGIGHESSAEFDDLLNLAVACLERAGVARRDLAAIASLDARRGGLVERLAAHFGVAARFYSAATLERATPRLANPSPDLFRRLGCHGVAEAAALAAAGEDSVLILPKAMGPRITCAIAAVAATLPNRR